MNRGGRVDKEPVTNRALHVPEAVVVATWQALRLTASRGCEGVALWAGPAILYNTSEQVVTTILVPEQQVGPGHFELPPEGVRTMGQALRDAGLVNVAQIHTHPDSWVGHSSWDDAHAYSLREGSLSIVWPHYGVDLPPQRAWGVHERLRGEWTEPGEKEAQRRVRIMPSVIDLRLHLSFLDAEHGERDVELET